MSDKIVHWLLGLLSAALIAVFTWAIDTHVKLSREIDANNRLRADVEKLKIDRQFRLLWTYVKWADHEITDIRKRSNYGDPSRPWFDPE